MQGKESYHGFKVRIEKSVPRNHCLASVSKVRKFNQRSFGLV